VHDAQRALPLGAVRDQVVDPADVVPVERVEHRLVGELLAGEVAGRELDDARPLLRFLERGLGAVAVRGRDLRRRRQVADRAGVKRFSE
jgi:hypothetical protein